MSNKSNKKCKPNKVSSIHSENSINGLHNENDDKDVDMKNYSTPQSDERGIQSKLRTARQRQKALKNKK